MLFVSTGPLLVAMLAMVLALLLLPLTVILLRVRSSKGRVARWLRQHKLWYWLALGMLLLGYVFVAAVCVSFKLAERDAATAVARYQAARYRVLSVPTQVRGWLLPAGTRLDLGHADAVNQAATAEFTTEFSVQNLSLQRVDWLFGWLVLRHAGRIDGWMCAADEEIKAEITSDQIRLVSCRLATERRLPELTLPAGTLLQLDILLSECEQEFLQKMPAVLAAGKVPPKSTCPEDEVQTAWFARLPTGGSALRWRGRSRQVLNVVLDKESMRVLRLQEETTGS